MTEDLWLPNVLPPGETVLACDPGLTTGFAVYSPGGETVKYGQVEGQMDWVKQADEVIFRYRPTIVIESFHFATGRALDAKNYSLEIIGAMRWFSEEYQVPFVEQTPAQAKKFATDDKLKVMGWYNATKGGHSNDALRHLLTFLATNRKDRAILDKLVEVFD